MSVFRVYAIRYAEREGRRGQHFHGYDDRWDEPHPTAYFVWLAVSESHTVLIDSGIRPERAAGIAGMTYLGSPAQTLAEMGVGPASVDHVILTHLHYDHTGTAHDFDGARYVLQRSELDYWTGPWAERITREQWLLDRDDVDHLLKAGEDGRLLLVDGDLELLPGLSVHLVGGHTAGMQVVRIASARGDVVVASDASHYYENIREDRPFAILHSMTGMYAAFDRINELAGGPELILPGHDPEVLAVHPSFSEALTGRVAVIA
ncbi:N-acyl homoserine lactonase family protein [Microbispora sp. NEAU-D428]|uniref:N-acyl homoserine lactonase family protein n=1 Tax=Microbispora sitophila TaxID=2771537 RepID=UPI001866C8BD|nr:N-acyl homoserine lactonase family protein [Microbispora sitophila]MBE3015031.1 N-acyl homoserine lactonase family protein [Microbispora sitophila]